MKARNQFIMKNNKIHKRSCSNLHSQEKIHIKKKVIDNFIKTEEESYKNLFETTATTSTIYHDMAPNLIRKNEEISKNSYVKSEKKIGLSKMKNMILNLKKQSNRLSNQTSFINKENCMDSLFINPNNFYQTQRRKFNFSENLDRNYIPKPDLIEYSNKSIFFGISKKTSVKTLDPLLNYVKMHSKSLEKVDCENKKAKIQFLTISDLKKTSKKSDFKQNKNFLTCPILSPIKKTLKSNIIERVIRKNPDLNFTENNRRTIEGNRKKSIVLLNCKGNKVQLPQFLFKVNQNQNQIYFSES